jgi:hypothetical protein
MLERRIDRVKDFGKESLRVAQSIQAGNLALGNLISDLRIAEQLSDEIARQCCAIMTTRIAWT